MEPVTTARTPRRWLPLYTTAKLSGGGTSIPLVYPHVAENHVVYVSPVYAHIAEKHPIYFSLVYPHIAEKHPV